MRKDIFGFFENNIDIPTHDPGIETICLICGNKLSYPIKTISLMKDGDNNSYFYRTHKECYETTGHEDIRQLESSLIDNI